MGALQKLIELAQSPCQRLAEGWREQGRKAVGFFCSYIPEEILYAGGLHPFRVRPEGPGETGLADSYMSIYNCSFARTCLDYALRGAYDSLDGVVFMNSCDHIRRLFDIWQEKVNTRYSTILSVPHKVSEEAVGWFRDEIANFKEDVEAHFGTVVTEQGLGDAIQTYNETRRLLKDLYELRKSKNPPLSGTEAHSVLLAATAVPRPQYNRLLVELLEELSEREGIDGYRARLMVVGSAYDDPGYTRVLEETGGLVVTDALCFGSRYFVEPAPTDGDPLLGLARAYLHRPACARMVESGPERLEFIKKMAEQFQVDAVIYQVLRNCDLWGGGAYYVERGLKEQGIPCLRLEREYTLSGVGGLKTRIEALLESIGR